MKRILALFGTVVGVLLLLGYGSSQVSAVERPYTLSEATSEIKIDGRLDESAWEQAVEIALPYETFPGDNTPAPVKTQCLMTYSRDTLYIGFRCFDPEPGRIRAHLMDRDAMETFVNDDYVSVLLDTFNDGRRAFQFRINPYGVQADAFYSELEGSEDFSWDAIWSSVGKITSEGYIIEVGIPFSQLRFARVQKEQVWGISIQRSYPRRVSCYIRSHAVDRDRQGLIAQGNKIIGFEKIAPGRNLEFAPTLTSVRTDKQEDFPGGDLKEGKVRVEPGLSARWGITSELMFNATVNPDFSQVEADVAQLDVNRRFALRYAEKRPFFLEGADFFLTPLETVFTRTVNDPLWGAKMTGKLGKNAIGCFVTQDGYTNLLFPANQGSDSTSLESDVLSSVLRYRRDIGKESTIGAIYTGRMGEGYYNHLVGADGFLRLSGTKSFTFQVLHSQTDYPDETAVAYGQPEEPFSGTALFANLFHAGRHLWYNASFQERTGTFRADHGFMPRVDIRLFEGFIEPIIWSKQEKESWFHSISFRFYGKRISDCDNHLTDQDLHLEVYYRGPLQTSIVPVFAFQKELYNGIIYNKKNLQVYAEMQPSAGINFTLFTQMGDAVDYNNFRLAKLFFFQPGVAVSPGKHLNISLNHTLERLSLDGKEIYTANLLQGKLIYNLDIRTFFRVILQYSYIRSNPGLNDFPVEPVTRTLYSQLLFSYKINSKTKLFLGYSDDQEGLRGIKLTRTRRTFFMKIGYAFTR